MTDPYAAADILQQGGVVLVPTDTNYALAVDPWNEVACKRLYEIKRRDPAKSLTMFLEAPEQLYEYARLNTDQAVAISGMVQRHWPGPLNLVVPKAPAAPTHRYFSEDSIAVVCNRNDALREVIRICGFPLGLTSANISGVSINGLVDSEAATATFADLVDGMVISEGLGATTMSSTIVSVVSGAPRVLRQGDVQIATAGR